MAHLGMVSIPAPGHVNPSLEILRRLVERGHSVTYVNDEAFRATVEGIGARFVPYASVLPRVNTDADDGDGAAFDGDAIDHLTKFQDEYEVMLPAVRTAFADDRPDLVLYDIAGVPARLLADEWGIPALQLSPTYVAWDGYEQDMAEFLGGVRADPRGQAYLTRQQTMLAAHGVTEDALTYLGRPARCLVLVPESMQPNADRVDREVYTFVGPALRRPDESSDWTPPGERRVVLVSLGTAFTRHPEFYRRCLEAFGGLPDWHLVLQIGRHVTPAEVTGGAAVPDHVEIATWVPQLSILRHASAFVTHAGMGGANEGLATGTPMIAVPQDVDQFDNADALVTAGVAVRLDSVTATVDELRVALAEVTSAPIVARSRAIADDIARSGGAERAVGLIEGML